MIPPVHPPAAYASQPGSYLTPANDIVPERPLPVLTSTLLSAVPGVVHGITRRIPALGEFAGNMSYSGSRDRPAAWNARQRWCAALDVSPDMLVSGGQVHKNGVLHVRAADAGAGSHPGSPLVGIADALITTEPGVVLLSMHADCLPIFLVNPDPERPAVAVVHAGWRGTVVDIAGATVAALVKQGAQAEQLLAYLGPAIGIECYEVGEDVARGWQGIAPVQDDETILRPSGDRWQFSLAQANVALLLAAGLPAAQIEQSGICTCCGGDNWFSHRGQDATTGRFGAMIGLRSAGDGETSG